MIVNDEIKWPDLKELGLHAIIFLRKLIEKN